MRDPDTARAMRRRRLRPAPGQPDGPGALLDSAIHLRDRDILQRVRDAIRHRQVMLVFQPVVQANAPERVAFHEAMLRVMDETGRIVPAREFIFEVEELEEGRILDCLALEQGIAELIRAPDLRLSVNMSARSIGYRRWMRVLEKGLAADPTVAARLILEITESSAMLLPELVIGFMTDLHRRGIAFAMDDFGAGQTVLRHFKRFSFDILKIDGQVIRGIDSDPDNQVLLRAIVAIAEQFDMFTVAESVETQAEAEIVARSGVNCLQGYYHGAPVAHPDWRMDPPLHNKA
ncbi:EAL domain, c-di-GMP-specific phosphodiesterase class I (or its enzymatically inactive variant) [Alloyangia pacifica]|uniref:EAL domain, c-di-GMP-specific phosphodiesterase class I (Or its enzymatically inactive variant) n=2 Tax=Alloyangia pacifica TaxID=311180 RepID=A0A1I6S7K6_9RHOB|nr:EAL domain, c-di-GMP-specific phosphodiesterase class I (or its enzymatically inactive variant) [Alloyangia pacifica]SFS72912.1 EAL domain, c-di-GMP-specific phosphodiesterase class I (or its enzymatically inactive variant) [Alloyangia pacifica]